jgi:plasmid maintenance system killer protein
MWKIYEEKSIGKNKRKIPVQVWKKYELWKDIIHRHGPDKLQEFPGFNDEALKGKRKGQRSSRLNIQYRVIYEIEKEEITVYVIEISPHEY